MESVKVSKTQMKLSTFNSDSSDSSNAKEERGQDSATQGESVQRRIRRTLSNAIVGTLQTFRHGSKEVRRDKCHITYGPTHQWWQPPLSAWIPEHNREILLILFIYITGVTALARFTKICGENSEEDVENNKFCSDDFILLQDKALNGFAVGLFLLLAFRANQAYDRFWEGRKSWGRMREVSRDFTRLVCSHVKVETDDDFHDRHRAINYVAAFAAAVKLHLRKERDIRRDLDELGLDLAVQDVANLQNASHMPLFCLDILSNYLAQQVDAGKLSDYQLGVINTTSLAVMSDTLGSCERIANTPIPLSYVLQLRFFLILWLVLYPLHVIPYYGWWSILICDLVSFAVLGIESMACEIENPFGYDRNDLDLDAYVKGFYNDTQEILGRAEFRDHEQIFDRKKLQSMSGRFDLNALDIEET
eukprot:CAMPEP_0198142494 /NCGR_PEP_ID=MMETSP1443-20131203/5268_1 /TAXON_ID=186043 /ORGANISM="Entomoneis sp., Strain CCMP2396" /LENGTH=418 /DNA_ID=CAMNT_0043805513 /DNA_START=21 /DNA_END=1277 /DNA_ORIENTATION=-